MEHKFDVKHLIQTICNSHTYQLSATPNESNRHDRQNHGCYYGKRLIAEVFLDAVDEVLRTSSQFNKMSRQARAVDLPHEGFGSYFLDVFDRPRDHSACECARSGGQPATGLAPVQLREVEDKIASDQWRGSRS